MTDFYNFVNENEAFQNLTSFTQQAKEVYAQEKEQKGAEQLMGLIGGVPLAGDLLSKGKQIYNTGKEIVDTGSDFLEKVKGGVSDLKARIDNANEMFRASANKPSQPLGFERDVEEPLVGDIEQGGILDRLTNAYKMIKGEPMGGNVQDVSEGIMSNVESLGQQVRGAVQGLGEQAKTAIQGVSSQVSEAVQGATTEAMKAGENIASAAKSVGEGVGEAAAETAGEAVGTSVLDVLGPVGEAVGLGLSLYEAFKPSHIQAPINYAYSQPAFTAGI